MKKNDISKYQQHQQAAACSAAGTSPSVTTTPVVTRVFDAVISLTPAVACSRLHRIFMVTDAVIVYASHMTCVNGHIGMRLTMNVFLSYFCYVCLCS